MFSKYLAPLASALLLANNAAAQLNPTGLVNNALCTVGTLVPITLSGAPTSAYPGQTISAVLSGQEGCYYTITSGGSTYAYLIPGAVSVAKTRAQTTIQIPAPLTAGPLSAQLLGINTGPTASTYLQITQCPAPQLVIGSQALPTTSVPYFSAAQGQTFPVTIQGTQGCTYNVGGLLGSAESLVFNTNAAQQTFYVQAPSTGTGAVPFTITPLGSSVGGATSLAAKLLVSAGTCTDPSLGSASSTVNVLAGSAFPLSFSGQAGCSYLVVIPSLGITQVVTPTTTGLAPLSITALPTNTAAGSYPFSIGLSTANLLSGGTLNVLNACDGASAPLSLDQATYSVLSIVHTFVPSLLNGVYGCTYDLTGSFTPTSGGGTATLTPSTISLVNSLAMLPVAFPAVNLPAAAGSGSLTVSTASSSVTSNIVSILACDVIPAFTTLTQTAVASINGVTMNTIPFSITGQSGCPYTVTLTGPGGTSTQTITAGGSGTPQPLNIAVPDAAGTYSLTIAYGNGAASSPVTLTVNPACASAPSFTHSSFATGINAGYSLDINGEAGCPYDIYLGGQRITDPTAPLQLPGTSTLGIFNSLSTIATPGSYDLAVVNHNADLSTATGGALSTLVVQPLCNIAPVLSSTASPILANAGEPFGITITGQAGCTYTLNTNGVNGAAGTSTTFTLPANQNSATFNTAIAPTTAGTYDLSLSLAGFTPSVAQLVVFAQQCIITFGPTTDLTANPPTITATITNAAQCGASDPNVYFTFATSNNQYPASVNTQGGDIFSYTFSNPISTVPNTVTIHAGASTQSAAVTFLASAPLGSIVPKKRDVKCAFDQDRCPFRSSGGKIAWECVADLYTNLERCGSCSGPDCSLIPHADTVACVDGLCIVSSCEPGYFSVGSECMKL